MPGKAARAPKGLHTTTPSLVSADAPRLLEFLKDGLGGKEVMLVKKPDGSIQHAEVLLGDSRVFVGQETIDRPAMACRIYLLVENVDKAYARALRADGAALRQPIDTFYGDRVGVVRDPVGNLWSLATHKERVSVAEQEKRLKAMNPKGSL